MVGGIDGRPAEGAIGFEDLHETRHLPLPDGVVEFAAVEPRADRWTDSAQDTPRNSSESWVGKVMSLTRSTTRSTEASTNASTQVPGSPPNRMGSPGPDPDVMGMSPAPG